MCPAQHAMDRAMLDMRFIDRVLKKWLQKRQIVHQGAISNQIFFLKIFIFMR